MADQTITREEKIERAIDKEVGGAIVVAGPTGPVSLVPKSMGEVMEFAKMMALSGIAVRQPFRQQPGACLAVTLQAMRWGMDPFAVANKCYVVNDQLAFEGQLVHAVVIAKAPLQKRLKVWYDGQGAALKCHVEGWLIGEDEPKPYVTPPFANIPVKNSPLWKADPEQQMHYYAVRAWARRWVPDVLLGVYAVDELEEQRNHQGPDNALDVTPARPTKGDAEEAERIRKEIEADEPKDFDLVDELGEVLAEGVGPRAFLKLIDEHMRTFKVGKYFERFIANNTDMIAALPDVPFAEKVDALRQDIESIRKSLTNPAVQRDPLSEAAEGGGAPPEVSTPAQPIQEGTDAASPASPEPEVEGPTPQGGPEAGERASGAENPPTEGAKETSAASAPQNEPISEVEWWTSDGKKKFFGNPFAWSEAIIKGVGKAAKADIEKVQRTNKGTMDSLLAAGGDWQTEAEAVRDALEKRLKELAK